MLGQAAEMQEFNLFLFKTNCDGHMLFCMLCILSVPLEYKLFQAGPACLFGTNSSVIQYRVHTSRGYTYYVNPLYSMLIKIKNPDKTVLQFSLKSTESRTYLTHQGTGVKNQISFAKNIREQNSILTVAIDP